MTNPDQTVGTNAGFNGRTTPNAMNDILGAFSRGRISGWACTPKSGMTIQLGGDGTTRDVAIAEDNAGNRLTIDNRTATPVEITLAGAPATGNRIDSIVAYIANPPQGAGATSVDFPDAVGIIAVQGTAAGTPSAPNETTIRAGITADGASGASAYYVVLANITVGQGVTTIGSGAITAGAYAQLSTNIVDPTPADGSITTAKLANGAVTTGKIANKAVNQAKTDLNSFGAMTYLGALKLTAATTVATFTLPAQYDNYKLRVVGHNDTSDEIWFDVRAMNGTTDLTTSGYREFVTNATWSCLQNANATFVGATQAPAVGHIYGEIEIVRASSDYWRQIKADLTATRGSLASFASRFNGRIESATEITGFKLASGGNMSAGSYLQIWGWNNSDVQ